ncbi:glycosyltransferase family 2 protein [Aminobacter anthyllidis]|uniref:glycosyltransferase family 2 protein n=1 Tax=Aminobacter anthyllidis TaxID=1035067 RepID=UPI002455E3CB|nr:glycosyltransferase family 2 protein [Aminobacter anthyllidis]MDH4984436.1 glycosyltransferase family 2 protein [Aminobacter anthyllidis]
MSRALPDLSIIIPVYRSQTVLPELVRQIDSMATTSKYNGKFELVLVNDCSPDESWRVIENLSQEYPFIRGISLRKNVGQHNATMAGLNYARGGIIVIMDDDLQHPPSDILKLTEQIERGYDVCYTAYRGRQHAAWKKLGSRFNDWVATKILNKPKGLYLSSFKALHGDIAKAITAYQGPYTYIDGLILDLTNSITTVEIDHQRRFDGEGNYNLRKSISLWLKMVTATSLFPLRVASLLGFGLSAISILLLMYVVIDRILTPNPEPGWASTVGLMLLVSSVQFICIGIVGEYIGRIYSRMNSVAQFTVRKSTFEPGNAVGADVSLSASPARSLALPDAD